MARADNAARQPLRLDGEQRFTCSQCGRCCRRPWEIVVTQAEAEAYRTAEIGRVYRERPDAPEGSARDPFEPIPGTLRFHRIRKRSDGACGFLSPLNRCRIHEELGARRKPLTCRMFPWRFHPAEGEVVVTTSFCCPTTIANVGAATEERKPEIRALRGEWFAVYPEKAAPRAFVKRRSIDAATLETLRSVLREMLDRPGAEGSPDLRANVRRIARTLEDLSRWRVLRLSGAAFSEYLTLTGRFAAKDDRPPAPRPPSRVARLLARGFLFVVAGTRLQVENNARSGLRLALRLRLLRLLLHFHGLGPGVSGIDLGAARRVTVDVNDAALEPVAYHYLRASLTSLGTGKRPVLEEIAVAVAFLNAALALAAMKSAETGRPVDRAVFSEALMEAVDLTHADDRGLVGRLLGALSGGVESLYLFAAGG